MRQEGFEGIEKGFAKADRNVRAATFNEAAEGVTFGGGVVEPPPDGRRVVGRYTADFHQPGFHGQRLDELFGHHAGGHQR